MSERSSFSFEFLSHGKGYLIVDFGYFVDFL